MVGKRQRRWLRLCARNMRNSLLLVGELGSSGEVFCSMCFFLSFFLPVSLRFSLTHTNVSLNHSSHAQLACVRVSVCVCVCLEWLARLDRISPGLGFCGLVGLAADGAIFFRWLDLCACAVLTTKWVPSASRLVSLRPVESIGSSGCAEDRVLAQ